MSISATAPDYVSYEEEGFASAQAFFLEKASLLNDPVCKIREYFYSLYILDAICKDTVEKVQKAAFFILGMAVFSALAPFTTPIAALIRFAVTSLSSKPYIYIQRNGPVKMLPANGKISIYLRNVCLMPAGFSISDGQITPPSDRERVDGILEEIGDPDLVCLCEVADIRDAKYISSRLPNHPYLIPVAGLRAIGPSSTLYVASKYPLSSIQFIPFIKGDELTGRAAFSEKGILIFYIKDPKTGKPVAKVIFSHLQHSEIPERPTEQEVASRNKQLKKIFDLIRSSQDGLPFILLGDFNQEEKELFAFLEKEQIDFIQRDPSVKGKPTWGGEVWGAKLKNSPPSKELVLDYALSNLPIKTKLGKTAYRKELFVREARSDHLGSLSTVSLFEKQHTQ